MIAIVKYNAGNIGSVTNALNRLGVENKVTDDPEELKTADKVIFPGVGEAGTAMNYLRERGLDEVIKNLKQPVLGICLGMQLMCSHSEEGDTDCLGIFDTAVKKFPAAARMKVPHMGWNSIGLIRSRKHKSLKEYKHIISNESFSPLGDQGVPLHHTTDAKSFENLKPFAKELRENMTESERILWSQLKERKRGIQFIRQKPVGPFIPDFVSYKYKLIIEVDGKIHQFQQTKDKQRQQWLEDNGYRVLRFENNEIISDLNNVLNLVDMAVTKRVSEFENQPLIPSSGRESESFDKDYIIRKSKLLRNIKSSQDVYYVHSYYAEVCKNTVAACDYILPFSSVLQKDNFYATQFHPEKSAGIGEQILKNFISIPA